MKFNRILVIEGFEGDVNEFDKMMDKLQNGNNVVVTNDVKTNFETTEEYDEFGFDVNGYNREGYNINGFSVTGDLNPELDNITSAEGYTELGYVMSEVKESKVSEDIESLNNETEEDEKETPRTQEVKVEEKELTKEERRAVKKAYRKMLVGMDLTTEKLSDDEVLQLVKDNPELTDLSNVFINQRIIKVYNKIRDNQIETKKFMALPNVEKVQYILEEEIGDCYDTAGDGPVLSDEEKKEIFKEAMEEFETDCTFTDDEILEGYAKAVAKTKEEDNDRLAELEEMDEYAGKESKEILLTVLNTYEEDDDDDKWTVKSVRADIIGDDDDAEILDLRDDLSDEDIENVLKEFYNIDEDKDDAEEGEDENE